MESESSNSIAVVTIASCSYLNRVSILHASVKLHEPSWAFYTVLVDGPEPSVAQDLGLGEILTPECLRIPKVDLAAMSMFYNVTEFSTAIKPFALLSLLSRGYRHVYYLDPDMELFGPLSTAEDLLLSHDVVLTPHNLVPIPDDGRQPSQAAIRGSGTFNLGFFAGSSAAQPLMEWWANNLVWGAGVEIQNNLFTDQRWMDFAPSYADVAILKDPGYNVAYWNLHDRPLTESQGIIYAAGAPLRVMHYSGYDPNNPARLAKYIGERPRVRLADSLVLRSLYESYRYRLGECSLELRHELLLGHTYDRNVSSLVGCLPPEIAQFLRHLRHEESVNFGTRILVEEGESATRAVERWLMAPRVSGAFGRLGRTAEAVWSIRPDLQQAFPEPGGQNYDEYRSWWITGGASELGLSPYAFDGCFSVSAQGAPSVDDTLPTASSSQRAGVNLVGYLNTESGVGEAARRVSKVLKKHGVPVRELPLGGSLGRSVGGQAATNLGPGLTLYAVNADSIQRVLDRIPVDSTDLHPRVGYWWWELEHVPDYFADAARLLDEIWAPTEFVYTNLKSRIGDKVLRAPFLVGEAPLLGNYGREDFDLPPNLPVFLVRFDFLSSIARKNPQAAIAAYRQAFPLAGVAQLLVKTTNGDRFPELLDELAWSVSDRADIRIWDESLDPDQNAALTAASDCYVSLHRSEGLGMNILEAMSLGVPVIATAYGGNMEFCTASNSALVNFVKVPVHDASSVYASAGLWAEPDVNHAAALMLEIAQKKPSAKARASRAQEHIAQFRNSRKFVDFVEARLRTSQRRSTADAKGQAHHKQGSYLTDSAKHPALGAETQVLEASLIWPSQAALDLPPVESVLETGRQSRLRRLVRRWVFRLTESNLWYSRRLVEDLAAIRMRQTVTLEIGAVGLMEQREGPSPGPHLAASLTPTRNAPQRRKRQLPPRRLRGRRRESEGV